IRHHNPATLPESIGQYRGSYKGRVRSEDVWGRIWEQETGSIFQKYMNENVIGETGISEIWCSLRKFQE
ncbi:MAG: hypothetical protein LUQ36_05315, partial [Methanoregula sp.]|nr:hypothetical protein [Methanoregula sp.]